MSECCFSDHTSTTSILQHGSSNTKGRGQDGGVSRKAAPVGDPPGGRRVSDPSRRSEARVAGPCGGMSPTTFAFRLHNVDAVKVDVLSGSPGNTDETLPPFEQRRRGKGRRSKKEIELGGKDLYAR